MSPTHRWRPRRLKRRIRHETNDEDTSRNIGSVIHLYILTRERSVDGQPARWGIGAVLQPVQGPGLFLQCQRRRLRRLQPHHQEWLKPGRRRSRHHGTNLHASQNAHFRQPLPRPLRRLARTDETGIDNPLFGLAFFCSEIRAALSSVAAVATGTFSRGGGGATGVTSRRHRSPRRARERVRRVRARPSTPTTDRCTSPRARPRCRR